MPSPSPEAAKKSKKSSKDGKDGSKSRSKSKSESKKSSRSEKTASAAAAGEAQPVPQSAVSGTRNGTRPAAAARDGLDGGDRQFQSVWDEHRIGSMFPFPRPGDQNQSPNTQVRGVDALTGQHLTHYDETAGVALAGTMVDAHMAMGHTVVPLVDAYNRRYHRLQSLVSARLLPKRDHLRRLGRQLQTASQEVEQARRGIERETMTDTEKILERLRTVESLRQSAIAHQWNTLSADLEAIERVIRHIELAHTQTSTVHDNVRIVNPSPAAPGESEPSAAITPATAARMIELIQQYADLSTTVDKLASKAVNIQVEFPTDDFPRETAQRLEVIGRCERYSHALAVKDQMLWTVIKENERLQERLDEETTLCQEYAAEMADWVEMTNSLGTEVQRLREQNEQLQLHLKQLQQQHQQHQQLPHHGRGILSL